MLSDLPCLHAAYRKQSVALPILVQFDDRYITTLKIAPRGTVVHH